MEHLLVYLTEPLTGAQSQALDALLRKRCAPGKPALARLAAGRRQGVSFGRYQQIPSLLRDSANVQRRLSGGRLLPAGPGVLELSVAAPALEDLTVAHEPIAAGQLLNRSVRGLLRGLESLGLQVVYPGRELITLARRALAHVAFDIGEAGRPLIQFHLALSSSLSEAASGLALLGGDAEGRADLLDGEACTSLEEALGEAPEMELLAEALARGFAQHVGAAVAIKELPGDLRRESESLAVETFSKESWLAERSPTSDMACASRIESQLGSFQVSLARGDDERIGEIRLSGEFIAGWPAVEALERELRGCPVKRDEIARVVDKVLNTPPNIVLGLGPRRTITDAILKALA